MKAQLILDPKTNPIDPFESIRNATIPMTVVSALIHPPRAQKTRWIEGELNLLLELITSGYPLDIIQPFFPLRSYAAVTKQAQRHGYRRQTDFYGNIIFEKGITSRKRGTIATGIAEVTTIKENSEKVSDVIVPKKQLTEKRHIVDPNRKAIGMLRRAALPYDPEIVCALTKHIIANQKVPA